MNYASILKQPLITEKTSMMMERDNQYVFLVDNYATSGKIKSLIELVYKVKVLSINTLKVKPKTKKSFVGKRNVHHTQVFKKAIITLSKDEKINLFDKK